MKTLSFLAVWIALLFGAVLRAAADDPKGGEAVAAPWTNGTYYCQVMVRLG